MYVVLYCGLRELSHSLSREEIDVWMADFFETGESRSSFMRPGTGKQRNRLSREYSQELFGKFKCAAFVEWIATVMNYNSPMRCDPEYEDFVGKWNDPRPLYVYWEDFLTRKDLQTNDRQENQTSCDPPNVLALAYHTSTASSFIISVNSGSIIPEGMFIVDHTPTFCCPAYQM